MKVLIRSVREFDLEDVTKHLLLVGDLTGDCFNCRELGIDYVNAKNCPKCKNEFRYIASRNSSRLGIKILSRLRQRRPDLVCIEFDDVKLHKNREQARNFLS